MLSVTTDGRNAPQKSDNVRGKPIGDIDKKVRAALAGSGPFLSSGLLLAISISVFGYVGHLLDEKFDTATPWYTIGGIVLALAGWLTKFLRDAMVMGREADEEMKETNKGKREG